MLAWPITLLRTYRLADLRPDLIAAITVGVVLVPQAVAFAQIAELPPNYGLNAAIVAAIVGGLWSMSTHLATGPTNAISLIVLSSLLVHWTPGSPEYLVAAGLMAVMAGLAQLVLGLARLGLLVNFVSHSVVVGFTTGAAVLIAVKQLKELLGLHFDHAAHSLPQTIVAVAGHAAETNPVTASIGVVTMVMVLVFKRIHKNIPGPLIALVGAVLVVQMMRLDEVGVALVGEVPTGLPPFVALPVLDLQMIGELSAGALAVAAIGVTETMSIAKSLAARSGDELDSNQELVSQGLANIMAGWLSGYAVAGSFSRSAIRYDAGSRTTMAGVLTGGVVLLVVLTVGPLVALIPKTALAGLLIAIAAGMIDSREIARIYRGPQGDLVIMVVTFAATMLLPLEFAVLLGVLLSFALYIRRTSLPQVFDVVPDERFVRLVHAPERPSCPQLGILTIHGDLYFGAVTHVEEQIEAYLEQHPSMRYLLIRMRSVNHCDFAGVHMLYSVYHTLRDRGGAVFFTDVHTQVMEALDSTGLHHRLGNQHFLDEHQVIAYLFRKVLDPAVCIYECPHRVFRECQNLPKREYPAGIDLHTDLPDHDLPTVSPRDLWNMLHADDLPPRVIDVREPREYRRGHVPDAESIPLAALAQHGTSRQGPVVVVCRSGRRSERAAHLLVERGHEDVSVLAGGMQAWEAEGLLEAIDPGGAP